MLAVFDKSVACPPAELSAPSSSSPVPRRSGMEILSSYKASRPDAICMQLNGGSGMACSHAKQALLRPRTFAVVDDIFCMFVGILENLPQLRQRYGLSKTVSEVMLVTEMYRVLRDRGPYSADQVIGDLSGAFSFVLYDSKERKLLVASDCHGKVSLFWGIAADGSILFSDEADSLKGCGQSIAPFPHGCFFSSSGGLRSFEHPMSPVTPVPRVDSQGQMCGSLFKVDIVLKDVPRFRHAGNEYSWAF